MQEKLSIKKKILQYLEYKGITKYKFYQETGITRGILDQENGMSEENTSIFLAYFSEVSAEWLLRGEGEMLRGQEPQPQTQQPATPPTQDERIAELKLMIDDLRYTIGMQKELIASLKAKTGEA